MVIRFSNIRVFCFCDFCSVEGSKAKNVRISEIQAVPQALNSGDVFVYDTGKEIWQVRVFMFFCLFVFVLFFALLRRNLYYVFCLCISICIPLVFHCECLSFRILLFSVVCAHRSLC